MMPDRARAGRPDVVLDAGTCSSVPSGLVSTGQTVPRRMSRVIALARGRVGSVLRAYGALRAQQREADARALREPLPWVLRLLAVQLAIQAFAWVVAPELRAQIAHQGGAGAWMFLQVLVGTAIGIVPEAISITLLELVLRFLPSWVCDRMTKDHGATVWPVGVAIAIAEGAVYSRIALDVSGSVPSVAVAVGIGAAANGVLLWWVVRRHGLAAAVWTRLSLAVGSQLLAFAFVAIAALAA